MLPNLIKPQRLIQPVPKPEQIYAQLRNNILNLTPAEICMEPTAQLPNVWGILMEMGFPNGAATLLSLAEGTTSLYFGSGGGILGSGSLETVAQASRAFLTEAERWFRQMDATSVYPLPPIGRVRFYALTYIGAFTSEADEAELSQGKNSLSPLFFRGQEVLTQIRLHQQKPMN